MVPASMFMYGSILMAVTRRPSVLRSSPVEEAMTPLPMPLMTPPETRTYFILTLRRDEQSRRSWCVKKIVFNHKSRSTENRWFGSEDAINMAAGRQIVTSVPSLVTWPLFSSPKRNKHRQIDEAIDSQKAVHAYFRFLTV